MKKLMIFAALMLGIMPSMAQDEKANVLVETFTNKSNASNVVANSLRQELVSGIVQTGRLNVVDAATLSDVPKAKLEKLNFLNELGIPYYIEGTLNTLVNKTNTSTSNGKTTTSYASTINYTLTIIETETGVTKTSETYNDSYSSGSTQDEAIVKAIANARGRMKRFVDNNFKVEAVIKQLDEVDKKKGAKTCYISLGSNAGITKGQIFEVFSKTEIAGEQIDKKIGEVKAEEVLSGTLTKCSVKSGGLDIMKEVEKGSQVTVRSRAKKLNFLEKASNALDNL